MPPSGDPTAAKLKQVTKIYNSKVKFVQTYKQILYIVGSDLVPSSNDFSPK